ncbi:MAG: hypothetical protein M5U28_26560 [Sandaracinaceae bacterium]|nr:hypothetical protein [Sandaracinaceae bacterium]
MELLRELAAAPDDLPLLERASRVAAFAAQSPWKVELGEAQNTVWKLLSAELPRWERDPAPESRERRVALTAMARDLGLVV